MEFEKLNAEERLIAEQAVLNFRSLNKACDDAKAGGKRSWRSFRSGNWVKPRLLKSGPHGYCRPPKFESRSPRLKPVIALEVGGLSGVGGSGFWTHQISQCLPTARNGSGKNS